MKKYFIIFGLVVFPFLVGQKIAFAAGGDFTVHPTYVHEGNKSWLIESIPAGKTITDYITLENTAAVSQKLTLEIYEASQENNIFTPSNSQKYKNIGSWIKIPEAVYQLAPHEKKKIPVIFTIPPEAKTAKYTAVIYAIQSKQKANNITFVTRIGTRIYLTVTQPTALQTSIFNSPEYKNTLFFILSFVGIMASIFYNMIHFLENKKYEKNALQ